MHPTTFNHQTHKKLFFYMVMLSCLLFSLMPEIANAATTGGGLPYEGWLTKLNESVTGPVAFAVSLIGIVVAGGVLIFGGDLNGFFRSLVFLVLVIGIIIGAKNMMSVFFGRGAEIAALEKTVTPPVRQLTHITLARSA
jgi:type IV secretion system protein TrbC